ncbi:MAG TPA: TIGR03435 family protein [Vicinamibacterales bacterium]|nr:TIGR03435 family protein [Vicinamibacterales bacterium]
MIALVALTAAGTGSAQTTAPRVFDVVSLKPNTSLSGQSNLNDAQGGHFAAENVSLGQLIRVAYGARPAGNAYSDVSGGPSWMYSDHFDIRATTNTQPDRAALLAMIRAMLADRFHLRTHAIPREESILELRLVREGRLGPRLKPSSAACGESGVRCSLTNGPGTIAATAVPMEGLAHMLSDWLDGHLDVRDHTGLTGRFAVDLTWSTNDVPLETALRDQLGLKLVAGKAQVPILIIDGAQKPGAD